MLAVVKYLSAVALCLLVNSQELPITETDVFVQSGEVSETSINIMARCNTEMDSTVSLMINGESSMTADVTADTDYTVTFQVDGLTSNTEYAYQVECSDSTESSVSSTEASFKTLPGEDDAAAFNFVWVADLAGQGWGRNPDFSLTNSDGDVVTGGYIVFDTMERLEPDFALFQGDMIYADNAIAPTKPIPAESNGTAVINGGTDWVNNPSKDFIAVTLDEFRANWKYNFGDEKMQSFLSKTPVFVQWDDHEVTNNWWPGETLNGPLYENGTAADLLYANSLKAFYEFNPIVDGQKLYRKQRFGKHIEIFFPDYRSYRSPNPDNDLEELAAMFGAEQLEWIKEGLKSSTATWKIISSHDPFGVVTGGPGDRDAFGQEDARILGREFEFQDLLETIHANDITGVISLTSDVHFTAHVNMHPDRAEGGFTDFKPMDEFVIGPIHSGSFGPNFQDTSFGAEYGFAMGPYTAGFERWANLPPSQSDLQSFGHASVSEDGTLEIKLMNIDGTVMYTQTLEPAVVDDAPSTEGSSSTSSVMALSVGFIFAMLVL